ncbi:MAG: molybdopterin molybdotransferase MoeA [Dehalococcoidia bacterium]|nr:molybdopterin molybdotransferase MoeA [Dehalococcoidia bacterium]
MADPHAHVHEHSRSDRHLGMPKMPSWLSVEEALDRILETVSVLDIQQRPLLEALGSVLAIDVRSSRNIPPLPNTAMDGYAVRFESVRGATAEHPAVLRVIGQLGAGHVSNVNVGPGEALRIMTGAPIPAGADAVIPFEDTDELERSAHGRNVSGEIGIRRPAQLGDNVRLAGEDVREGELVLEKGTVLRPAEIGLLASLWLASVAVVRRPVVAILATGDELVEPPIPLAPGQIYDSNSYGLAASVLKYGGVPKLLGIARDEIDSLQAKVREGMEADFLLTSAGVSRGDYDIVKDVLMKEGDIAFWTVRMRPAKPLAFGLLRHSTRYGTVVNTPHIGLPGNPVSALVAFEEFARPAILKMQGRRYWGKPTIQAILEEPIHNDDGRRVYARVHVEKRDAAFFARLTGPQGSGILSSLAKANGLAICPEDREVVREGEMVEVQMLDWQEERS